MTYSLVVSLESYEFEGEFYLVGEGCATPGDVLLDVAADHILTIDQPRPLHEYFLAVLWSAENVSRAEYEAADADIECRLYADVYYSQYLFEWGDKQVEIPAQPTWGALESVADQMDS